MKKSKTSKKKLRKRRSKYFSVFPLLFFLWILGFLVFFGASPTITKDSTTKVDAIIVLTGGPHRVPVGLRLLGQGLGKALFISGVNPQVRLQEILRYQDKAYPIGDTAKITLGYVARDTPSNAMEVAAWTATRKVRTIRLVTADFHMMRSLLELRNRLPEKTLIIPHSVPSTGIKRLKHFFIEYNKYLVTWLRIRVEG